MPENNFTDWLESRHSEIMGRERQALELMAKGDIAGYRAQMRAKAELLAGLADAAVKAGYADSKALAQLRQFSASAATALDLGSVFYMSALLYPDEHKAGKPDNLQKLIATLKNGDDK